MPGAQEVYNADTEISKWHVRWSSFLLSSLHQSLGSFWSFPAPTSCPKPSPDFHTRLPFISTIATGRSLKVARFHSLFISAYVLRHCSHAFNRSHPLAYGHCLHRFDRLADAPVENGQIHKKYDIIQPDGLAGVGERVDPGDVYINKQTPANANDNSFTGQASVVSYKNSPMMYKSPISGIVDKVMITDTDNDQTLIKVLIRQTRTPELGDKFSSRHGQKGVCGLIVNQEDMPFNDQGICPGER